MNPIITHFLPIDQFTWWLYYYKSLCALFLSYLFANILINFSKKKRLVLLSCSVSYTVYAPGGGGGGGGGGNLVFSRIRRLWLFFGVQNFEYHYFWGHSEKLIFLGIQRYCGYFLGVITKLDYI